MSLCEQAVVNCAMEMDNFFEREGAHGAAAIPYVITCLKFAPCFCIDYSQHIYMFVDRFLVLL